MKFLIANSPTFPVDLAARLAEDTFGISGTLSALYSERDQNFRVAGGVSGDFVLKISNAEEDPDLVAAQIAALEFLARTAPDLPLPRVRRTLAGAAQIDLPGEGDARHATFALTYLPGQIASDAMLGADEFHAIGRMIARVERGMRGFFHPALGDRALLWDIRQLGRLRDKCHHLGPDAPPIRELLDEVTEALSGRLEGLAAQVIHGDIHGHNLILGPDRAISGIIDFGDMFHGPAILNLTNALADFQHENDQTQGTWAALIRGYAGIRRIEPEELALLYDLTLARHLVRGEGVWLYDVYGRRYMDLYNNVPIVGHCNPRVADAIAAQTRILNTNTRYLGTHLLDYAERLGALTGGALTACAFVNSGSEANDIAWRMAREWTGNRGALTQEFAYHGITEAIDAMSPSALRDARTPDHVRTILGPDGYRGPFRHGTPDMGRRYAEDADRAIASLAEAGMKPAAVITDCAFLTNGVLEPVPGYVAALFDKVRAAGGLCIADEVQSGFGRMGGHFWGYQQHGVTPDFVTIGKPAGNGHPIGVVLTRPEILDHFLNQTAFFSTFGGNNVSCAAGLAVLDEIRNRDLVANASTTGARFKAGLNRLAQKYPIIGDVRGIGLVFGLELVTDRQSLAPAPVETTRLLELMRGEGILAGSEGVLGNIIKMRPPLVFSASDCDHALAALDRSLSRLC